MRFYLFRANYCILYGVSSLYRVLGAQFHRTSFVQTMQTTLWVELLNFGLEKNWICYIDTVCQQNKWKQCSMSVCSMCAAGRSLVEENAKESVKEIVALSEEDQEIARLVGRVRSHMKWIASPQLSTPASLESCASILHVHVLAASCSFHARSSAARFWTSVRRPSAPASPPTRSTASRTRCV